MTTYSHMRCPFCSSATKVYNSRSSHSSTQTWRRRKCLTCNRPFTTREKVDFNGTVTVLSHNEKKPYSRERLILSLVSASKNLDLPSEMLSELTDSIELTLNSQHFFESESQEAGMITTVAITVLSRYDKNLAIQYINNVYSHKPPLAILSSVLNT